MKLWQSSENHHLIHIQKRPPRLLTYYFSIFPAPLWHEDCYILIEVYF